MPNDAQRVAERQRQWGFDVTGPTEIYRSPEAEPPSEVVRLDIDRAQVWDEQQQIDFAQRAVARNRDAHDAKARAAATALPPPAKPAPDTAMARATLGTAILRYAELHELAARADEAVGRANDRVAECDGQLEDYRNLDVRITAFHADSIRRGIDDPLPCDLERQQAERGRVIDRLCAVRQAAEQLKREAKAAHDAVAAADVQRGVAATAIITSEMDKLAARLEKLTSLAASMRTDLATVGSTYLPLPNQTTVLALSSRAVSILTAPLPPLASDPEFAAMLRSWHGRLMNDSKAELDPDVDDAPCAA